MMTTQLRGIASNDFISSPFRTLGSLKIRSARRKVRHRDGSLLVVTLWLVTILSVLAVAIARYLSVEVRLTKYRLAREQAKALARSGVYLAIQRLMADATEGKPTYEPYDWLGDEWAIQQDPIISGVTQVSVSVTDEDRKLNINAITQPVLERLGVQSEQAGAIIDYIDVDQETPTVQPPYYPKNGPISALEELLDIPGLDSETQDMLQRELTTFTTPTTPPTLNINTVEERVLVALNADRAIANQLVSSRPGDNGIFGDDDDCRATSQTNAGNELSACAFRGGSGSELDALMTLANFTVVSSTFRIRTEAFVEASKVRYRIDAVVQRSNPPVILSWREGT